MARPLLNICERRRGYHKRCFTHGTLERDLGNWKLEQLRRIHFFPAYLRDEQADGQQATLDGGGEGRRPNLSAAAQAYLDRLGLGVEDLFHHALATLHDPAYRAANAGALRMEWPRIPLPGWPGGNAVLSRRATLS